MKTHPGDRPRPRRVWALPIAAVAVNQLAYNGGHWIARNRPHYCLELPIDRLVPFLPWTVSIYLACFLFWAAVYLYMAGRERERAFRFFRADFAAKLVCFLCFVLLPTTNVRPPLGDASIWDRLLGLVYRVDAPTNLFPSIHCMVSWLCFAGVRGDRGLPLWSRAGACLFALAVCLSTLTTRQHVAVDVLGGVLLAEACWRAAAVLPRPRGGRA